MLHDAELLRHYRSYLARPDLTQFLDRVNRRYTVNTLHQLLRQGTAEVRRAAVLYLGWMSGRESQDALGLRLRDRDRGVRLLSYCLLPDVWLRACGAAARECALRIRWLNSVGRHAEAHRMADSLRRDQPEFDEAWIQRGLASHAEGDTRAAMRDLRRVLDRNPFHFEAAIGLGHCFRALQLNRRALAAYQQALTICPELQQARIELQALRPADD
jgi:tetratricopeptide (TPR) repeat protein